MDRRIRDCFDQLMNLAMRVVTVVTAAGCGFTAGALFAFSTVVMPALGTLPAPRAVAAMQAMNLAAPRSLLMLPLLTSPAGCLAVGVYALAGSPDRRWWLLVGAVAGLLTFAITATFHIPRNDALAALDPGAADAADVWPGWASAWSAGNHLRTLTGLAAGALLLVGALPPDVGR